MQNCSVCNKRISVFECNITKTLICNYCCDKYQLNQWTEGWERYFYGATQKYKRQGEDLSDESCLDCKGLCRDEKYEVFTEPERGFGFNLFAFNHKGKFVFTNNPDHIFPKRKAFLEKTRCENLEDYFYLAETYYFLGEYNKSIELLIESIEKYNHSELYRLLGQSYHFKGDKEKAISNFKKSLFLCETSAVTNRYMADLLRSMKDYEGSIYYYKESIKLLDLDDDGNINDSFHEYNYFGLAIAYSKIHKYEQVIEVANEFLSWYRIEWEDLKERVLTIRSGKAIDNNWNIGTDTISTLYEILSIAYIELDNLDKAEEYMSRAKWLDPDDIDIARIEGIIIGKRSSEQKYKKQLETLKMNAEIKLFDSIEKVSESVEEVKKNIEELNKESPTDIFELKPNFMGIGLNINEVIKKLIKKK